MLDEIQHFPYARLVYLIIDHQIVIPKNVVKWIPGGDWLREIAISPVKFSEGNPEQVISLYKKGKLLGPGTRQEAAMLLGEYVDLLLDTAELNWTAKHAVYEAIENLGSLDHTLEYMEVDLGEPGDKEVIPKWNSGFLPLDAVTGGLYQGIITLMSPPGGGKTSLAMTIAEEVRKNNVCNSLLIVQTEIPGMLIKARMQPIFSRTQFKAGIDTLVAASWTTSDIIEYVEENPDPERIIIYDSPDTPIMGGGEGTRFMIAKAFKDLIDLKQKCKCIIVTTWPRRGDRIMSLESASEGASKERFSDMLIAVTSGGGRVSLRVLKNRFGEAGKNISFNYDFANMVWQMDGIELEEDW